MAVVAAVAVVLMKMCSENLCQTCVMNKAFKGAASSSLWHPGVQSNPCLRPSLTDGNRPRNWLQAWLRNPVLSDRSISTSLFQLGVDGA